MWENGKKTNKKKNRQKQDEQEKTGEKLRIISGEEMIRHVTARKEKRSCRRKNENMEKYK